MSARKITATVSIGGMQCQPVSVDCDFNFTQNAGTFRAEIALNDPSVDMGTLANAAPMDITISVMGASLFQGVVDDVNADYVQGAVHISGRDNTAKLIDAVADPEVFRNRKRSDVVTELAGRVGLSATVVGGSGTAQGDAGKQWEAQHSASITNGQSYWSIIQRYAQIDGVSAYVRGSNLYYGPDMGGQTRVFQYRAPSPGRAAWANFEGLHVRRNVNLAKTLKVSVSGYKSKKKAKVRGQAVMPGRGGELNYPDFRQNNLADDAQAQALAQNRLNAIAQKEFGCSVRVPGDPALTQRGMIALAGTDFDGVYTLESVHHHVSIHSPYVTTLHGARARS